MRTLRLPRTVIALSFVSLFTDASSEMIYPLVPVFLATTLGASARWVGAIEGTAEMVASILKLASGQWSDRMRRRKPLVLVGYGIASVLRPLIGLAQAAPQVFAIRVGDRVGKGLRSAPRDAMIADAVDPAQRGRAYGLHRAADHAGAVVGPLVAFVLLQYAGVGMRTVFLLAAVPAALAMVTLVWGVREVPRETTLGPGSPSLRSVGRGTNPEDSPSLRSVGRGENSGDAPAVRTVGQGTGGSRHLLRGRFGACLAAMVVFTLGNSTDAFLLLRAGDLGVSAAHLPLLWALLHVVKAATSAPGGALSDRVGRLPLILAGWTVYAAVYLLFGLASLPWHAWALFGAYGVFYGLTEGVEKALVADLVPPESRGKAFGWYHLAIGIAVLPAALIFGAFWDAYGARPAFAFGSAMAALAAVVLWMVAPPHSRRAKAPIAP